MVVFSVFLMKAQEKQHNLSEKNKRKDFIPKKDDESKSVKKKFWAKFIQRYVENNILSSIEF